MECDRHAAIVKLLVKLSLSYCLFACSRFLTLSVKQQISFLLFGGMLPGNKDTSLNRFKQECSELTIMVCTRKS